MFQKTHKKFMNIKKHQLAEFCLNMWTIPPVEIETIFDLFWWCNFCFKWQDVDSRMIFTFSDTSDWRSTISFFNTENFQKWSIVNHDVNEWWHLTDTYKYGYEILYKQICKR